MKYQEFPPCERLKEYVKCFYVYESSTDTAFEDTVFPSGSMEIIFNLGGGTWQTLKGEEFVTTPTVELWGQIVKPLIVRSQGKNTMMGVRFFPHATACFMDERIELFNNHVADLCDIMGQCIQTIHMRLLEMKDWNGRIKTVEDFLVSRLSRNDKRDNRIAVVSGIMQEIRKNDFYDNIENVASRYGITSRYLQKLFLQYTGLTPKLYTKISRFQNSLSMVTRNESSLTSIAYDCGYFDQSHFIRDFKMFTGITPSVFSPESSPITAVVAK